MAPILTGMEPLWPYHTPEWYFCHVETNQYDHHTFHHLLWDDRGNDHMNWFVLPKWFEIA